MSSYKIIEHEYDVVVLEANFVEAANSVVYITSTSLDDFSGPGMSHVEFDLVDTPSDCEE